MGKPMSLNVLKHGYPLTVTYHRNREPAVELGRQGAQVADSAAEVAALSDIVITMLPADKEIFEVYTSPDGLIAHLAEGAVCIDMTSAKPQTMKELEARCLEKGIGLLDAPVSGGMAKAVSGELTIMAGGEKDLFERHRAILETMGTRIYYTGEAGSGKAIKMINQLINAGNTYIAAEALYLAERLELDMELFYQVVSESSGGSYVFDNAVKQAMIPRSFDTGFKLDLMKKDFALSMAQAGDDGISLPVLEQIFRMYEKTSEQGHGSRHYAVVSEQVRQQNEA